MTEAVSIPFFHKQLDANGKFQPGDTQDEALKKMLDEVAKYATALKTMR